MKDDGKQMTRKNEDDHRKDKDVNANEPLRNVHGTGKHTPERESHHVPRRGRVIIYPGEGESPYTPERESHHIPWRGKIIRYPGEGKSPDGSVETSQKERKRTEG